MDRKRMIGEVAARHGIRLEEDDPAFVLVTLAELMLKDAQDEFAAVVRKSIGEYEEAAERVQERAGHALAVAVRYALHSDKISDEGCTLSPPLQGAIRPARRRGRYNAAARSALVGLVTFLLGLATGRMFLQ